jgi:hypothetical protein
MGGALLRRRDHRRLPSALSGGGRLRLVGLGPADHVARLRAVTSKEGGVGAFTLDDVIARAWYALGEWETVQCPLCGGEMSRGGKTVAGAEVEEGEPHGECADCGTRLS